MALARECARLCAQPMGCGNVDWHGKDRHGTELGLLATRAVNELFVRGFRQQCRDAPDAWTKVPHGSAPSLSVSLVESPKTDARPRPSGPCLASQSGFPRVQYQQGEWNVRTPYAGANALHHEAGDEQGALGVAKQADRRGERLTSLQNLPNHFRSVEGWSALDSGKFYPAATSDRHRTGLAKYLVENPCDEPVVAGLSPDHFVAIAKDRIYDSNFEFALPLSLGSLEKFAQGGGSCWSARSSWSPAGKCAANRAGHGPRRRPKGWIPSDRASDRLA